MFLLSRAHVWKTKFWGSTFVCHSTWSSIWKRLCRERVLMSRVWVTSCYLSVIRQQIYSLIVRITNRDRLLSVRAQWMQMDTSNKRFQLKWKKWGHTHSAVVTVLINCERAVTQALCSSKDQPCPGKVYLCFGLWSQKLNLVRIGGATQPASTPCRMSPLAYNSQHWTQIEETGFKLRNL